MDIPSGGSALSDFVVHPDIDKIRHKNPSPRFLIYILLIVGVVVGAIFLIYNNTPGASASIKGATLWNMIEQGLEK